MIQQPNAVGLLLCEKTIVEEATRNVTVVNHLTHLRVDSFPSVPQRLMAYAMLTDGIGAATLGLRIIRLDTFEDIYYRSYAAKFRDPLAQLRLRIRVNDCSFPVEGKYQVQLEADGELVAQAAITVIQKENIP